MTNFEIDFLNDDANNSISYLPFGVTTIEISPKGDPFRRGEIRPKKNNINSGNKKYLGFADNTEDFLIIWGSGNENGQHVDSNTKREFFSLIHLGDSHNEESITFEHTGIFNSKATVHISSAFEAEDIVRMKLGGEKNGTRTINFEGKKIPKYYSRWFPPNRNNDKQIEYIEIPYPKISVQYKDYNGDVGSSISICVLENGEETEICSIDGDLAFSRPHVELFSLIPESEIFVIRFWLYWIHKNFTEDYYLALERNDNNLQDEFRIGIPTLKNEIPDIERFDFIFDATEKKVIWVGTDFHFQEHWGQVSENIIAGDNPVVQAEIVGPRDVIRVGIQYLVNRYGTAENPDPFKNLVARVSGTMKTKSSDVEPFPDRQDIRQDEEAFTRVTHLRAHVPYCNDVKLVKDLTSPVVNE